MWFVSLSLAAPGFEALDTDAGWRVLSEHEGDVTGPVTVEEKTVDGAVCLRGRMRVDLDPDGLYAVVTDIRTEPRWSSETLTASEVLHAEGSTLEYYQHLSVPRWTMAADRFWVLRGRDASASGTREFRWERFAWEGAYPELASRIARESPGAVEPATNLGSWRFERTASGTVATYAVCTDAGGSIPQWVQRRAASQALPGTMADVAREAARRALPTGP